MEGGGWRDDMDSGISSSGDIVREWSDGKRRVGSGGRRTERMVAMANINHSNAATSVNYQQQPQYAAPEAPRRWHHRVAQKLERWIFLYNVTTGLYMLDWWERCIFNAVFLIFFAVAGYNSGHYLQRIATSLLAWLWWGDSARVPDAVFGDGGGGVAGIPN